MSHCRRESQSSGPRHLSLKITDDIQAGGRKKTHTYKEDHYDMTQFLPGPVRVFFNSSDKRIGSVRFFRSVIVDRKFQRL